MKQLKGIIKYQCKKCNREDELDITSNFELEYCSSDRRNMGTELCYSSEWENSCKGCGHNLSIDIEVYEYPEGMLDNFSYTEEGVKIMETRDIEFVIDDVYDEYYEAIVANKDFRKTFTSDINKLRKLNYVNIAEELEQTLKNQIYIGIIACMEAYLSDAFYHTVINNKKNLRKFVETYDGFKEETINFRNIYSKYEGIEKKVKNILLDKIIYHTIKDVAKIYLKTLNVNLADYGVILKAVNKRHDIVHRNGKTKADEIINISRNDIEKLMNEITSFIDNIDIQIKKL